MADDVSLWKTQEGQGSAVALSLTHTLVSVLAQDCSQQVRLLVVSWATLTTTADDPQGPQHGGGGMTLLEHHAQLEHELQDDPTVRNRTTILRPPKTDCFLDILTGSRNHRLPVAVQRLHARTAAASKKSKSRRTHWQGMVQNATQELAKYVVHEVIHGQHPGLIVNIPP